MTSSRKKLLNDRLMYSTKYKSANICNIDNELDIDFQALLSTDELNSFHDIVQFFRRPTNFKQFEYYSYIKSLCNFSSFGNDCADLNRAFISSITTTILNMKYICDKGQFIAVNITRLAQLISKNKRVLQNFFNNTDYFQKVTFETLNFEFSSNGKAGDSLGFKLISICNLLKQFNMNTDFYFFKHKEHVCYFKFNKSLVIDKKKQNKLEKKYPNNYNYFVKWKKSKVAETSNIQYKNQLKNGLR